MGGFFCGLVCFCFLWLQIWLLSAQKRSWMNTFDMCPKYIKNERALRCTRFVPNYVNAKMGLTWHIMLFGVAVNHNFGLLLCSHLLCVIIMFSYVLICFVLLLLCSLTFSSALCYSYYVLLRSHLLCVIIILFSYVLICFVLLLLCSLTFSSALCYYYHVLLCSHLLCVIIIMFSYILICFASAIDAIWWQCWLCA